MVRRTSSPFPRLLLRASALVLLCLLTSCAATPRAVVAPDFNPLPELGVIHVFPFVTTLVPEPFAEAVFNTFVDDLNGNRNNTGVRWFYIAKEEMQGIDPQWLAKQVYITGEIWGYVEETGCCSAEVRVKARIRLHQAGKKEPAVEVFVPLEYFFPYDKTTLVAAREQLALKLADELAMRTLAPLTK